ncbi:PA14 domain-containing protein [Dickeya oryzae]
MAIEYSDFNLTAGNAVRYWQLSDISSLRYDTVDLPMAGEMDPFFFLSKHKNFIPHTYPCRDIFRQHFSEQKPQPFASANYSRWWFPFASDRVDLSGFWFRPTRVGAWARTLLDCPQAGEYRFRLTTCGGAVLKLNGEEVLWMADYQRNLESQREFNLSLHAGKNELEIWFDDLAERDIRFFFELDYLAGEPLHIALETPLSDIQVKEMEQLLDGVSFEHPVYNRGTIRLAFPQPSSTDYRLHVNVLGDFISLDKPVAFHTQLTAGESLVAIAESEEIPADFRNFHITLQREGFQISRTLGVEICHADRQKDIPQTQEARIAEALSVVAHEGEYSSVKALARLACGLNDEQTQQMLEGVLPSVLDCHDCADFTLVPLLWCRTVWGDEIDPAVRGRIDDAILRFRYWMDEPGNDVQWYFSENHALLFHTAALLAGNLFPEAIFTRSGRSGREQAAAGKARVITWLDHFEQCEMAEWNSAPYFPIDLKGLTALAALSGDAQISKRAIAAIERLLTQIARSAHHGFLTASQGRSYEHTLRAGRSLELAAISRLLWGKGNYGCRFHALPQLALLLRDGLLNPPSELADVAAWQKESATEWCFAQGANRIARLYHYKNRHAAMGSIAGYRWGEWGYQETPFHLRLGSQPEAQIWINHPGETLHGGFGRPSYWGGCGTLPRVQQYRGLAVLIFNLHEGQPSFTHAWLPQSQFDEVAINNQYAAVRSGDGMALLMGNQAFETVNTGPTRDCEIRLNGQQTCWLVRINDRVDSSLDTFRTRFSSLAMTQHDDGSIEVNDPLYGTVRFFADGRVNAEGRTLDPQQWSVIGSSCELPL